MSRRLAMFIMLALAGLPATAYAGDVYLVRDVPVSSSAASAAQARAVALRNGHGEALASLLHRITLPEHRHRLPAPSGRDAQEMALGFEVEDEKSSNVRYLGKLSVRFAPDKVRALLQRAQVPFGDIQARPALLLVLQREGDDPPTLWETVSPLQQAFEGMDLANDLIPLILPAGDAGDRLALSGRTLARLAENQEYDGLFALMNRYDLRHALLVEAREDTASNTVAVSMAWLKPTAPPARRSFVIQSNGETPEALRWGRVARTVINIAADSWKRRVLVSGTGVGEQRIAIYFRSQRQWNDIRERLRTLPVMRGYRLHSLSARAALVDVNVAAPPDIFALALAQEDILLDTNSTPWRLTLSQ